MKKAPAWVKALMLMCFLAGADASGAAGFPEKPIKVVTPFTPGSAQTSTPEPSQARCPKLQECLLWSKTALAAVPALRRN